MCETLSQKLSEPDLSQRVGLIDWDELGSKAKANQGDPHLLAAHDRGKTCDDQGVWEVPEVREN